MLGLDLSLNSPGIVVANYDTRVLHAYFFPSRLKHNNMRTSLDFMFLSRKKHFDSWVLNIQSFEKLSTKRYEKCNQIISHINKIIDKHAVRHVIIEDYAYSMSTQSSTYLHELGGALKCMLCTINIPFSTLVPTTVKKQYTGYGNATKYDMWLETITVYNIPDLIPIFKFKHTHKIPNPVQDIIDAIALVVVYNNNMSS